jgi:hypothetical protein
MDDNYNAKVDNFITVSITQLNKRVASFTYFRVNYCTQKQAPAL